MLVARTQREGPNTSGQCVCMYITVISLQGLVNVGKLCAFLGGGGHPTAAAATVKDRTTAQVCQFHA